MMALRLAVIFLISAACEIVFIDAFRTDYTYVDSTRSFYKFHQKDATWAEARSTCQSEGALLFHPENEQELRQVVGVLGIGENGGMFINAGYSYLTNLKDYQTVDGRPIANVYNKWDEGQPKSGENAEYRCGRLRLDTFVLVPTDCVSARRYICKHYQTTIENVVRTAIEDVKTIIANSTDKIAEALERQTMNLTASDDKPIASLLERLVEAIANQAAATDKQTEAIQRQVVNQTSALDRMAASLDHMERLASNQVATLDRHTEAFQREAANQTAAIQRQALAMEKLTSLLEENSQIDVRSEQ